MTAPAFPTGCFPTCSDTRARPTCSITAPTSAWCRSCSGTPVSRPRRSTRRCRRNGCVRSTTLRTLGRGAIRVAEPAVRPEARQAARHYTRCMADTSLAVVRDHLQEERDRLRAQIRELGGARSSTSTRTSPTPVRSPRSGAKPTRSPASSPRRSPRSTTRSPSSMPATTARASRASRRSAARGSRRCPRHVSASPARHSAASPLDGRRR